MKNHFFKPVLCTVLFILFVGPTTLYGMDFEAKNQKLNDKELPKLDRAFFCLENMASDDEYFECLNKLLSALKLQQQLINAMQTRINLEQQTRKIESEWIDYCKHYYTKLLQSPDLLEVNKSDIALYFENYNSLFESTPIPIICTTPSSMAAVLMYRDLIHKKVFPNNKNHIISKLIQSENKEIQFLGRYFSANKHIGDNNVKFESAGSLVEMLTHQFEESIKYFTQPGILKLFTHTGQLISEEKLIVDYCRKFLDIDKLTKEQLWRIDEQHREKVQVILDTYNNDSSFFNNLIQKISDKICERQKKELFRLEHNTCDKEKEKIKNVEESPETIVSNVFDSTISPKESQIIKEKQKLSELPCSNTSVDKHFVPDFCYSKKFQKHSDGYTDGAVLKKESCHEIVAIDDPDNKMKIFLYAVTEPGVKSIRNKKAVYPLNYMENVYSWFINSEKALEKNLKMRNKKFTDQGKLEALRIHRFSRHVDRFIFERGIEQQTQSWIKNGQKDLCITIPGHIEYYEEKKPKSCIFVYLIDSKTGQCYHRNIEFKNDYAITHELLDEGSYKINVPLSFTERKK